MPNWILLTQTLTYVIFAILIGLSVWSVSIMIDRHRYLKALRSIQDPQSLRGLVRESSFEALQSWARANDGRTDLLAGVLRTAVLTPARRAENIDRAVKGFLAEERLKMEKGMTVLATLGSNAPFIGLLGTVLGIIQAFGVLASDSSGTQSVISGVAEALIATAVGLFVAIPAVVAYNAFNRRIREALTESEVLKETFVSRFVNE